MESYDVLYPVILSMIWFPFQILPPFWVFAARIQFKAKSQTVCFARLYTSSHQKNQTHKAIISEAPETRSRSASLRQKWFWWRVWAPDIKFTSFFRLSQGHDVKRWGSLVRLCLQSAISWWVISSDLRCASYTKGLHNISMYIHVYPFQIRLRILMW